MHTKNFDNLIKFYEVHPDPSRPSLSLWYPLVEVNLISPVYGSAKLSLLFDTGASFTTLKSEFYPLLGLQRWDEGIRVPTSTVGGVVPAYQYTATLEILGKTIECPIHLSNTLVTLPFYVGLLGRDTVYNEFGFGFWESTHELYTTTNP